MKTTLVIAALLSMASVQAFAPAFRPASSPALSSQRNMFSGSGTGTTDDDPEAQAKMEQTAKAMGMSVEEYQLGVKARVKLNNDLDTMRVKGGSEGITVERCGNNPPKFLEITITEDGKAKGKETVQKEIVVALKAAGEDAKKGRAEAQKNMVRGIVMCVCCRCNGLRLMGAMHTVSGVKRQECVELCKIIDGRSFYLPCNVTNVPSFLIMSLQMAYIGDELKKTGKA